MVFYDSFLMTSLLTYHNKTMHLATRSPQHVSSSANRLRPTVISQIKIRFNEVWIQRKQELAL